MSVIKSFLKQQLGSVCIRDYSISLSHLKCFTQDVYRGISPNAESVDFTPEPPVFACRFATTEGYEHYVALANEDGKIALQDTTLRNGSDVQLEGSQAHFNAIFDISWMPNELKLVTASGDHSARLWDINFHGITQVQCFQAHTRSIKSAIFRPNDKAVFVTGARDGVIMIWDIRAHHGNSKPDNVILNAHSLCYMNRSKLRKTPNSASKHINKGLSITALAFQDGNNLLSCSTGDGMIKVWDIRKNYSVHKREPIAKQIIHHGGKTGRNGFTSLLVCPTGNTLYASCMDNTIYAYNLNSYGSKPTAEYYGHENSTFYVKACLSPDGEYLASGSSDENAYIWKTKEPGLPLLKLSGHTEEVTCIAWCNINEPKIVTCSDDSRHRIWRIDTEEMTDERNLNLKGHAEPISHLNFNHRRDISILETTPTIQRTYPIEYSSGSDVTPGNTPRISNSNSSDQGSSSMKRSYSEMQDNHYQDGKYKSILSPIQENLEKPSKRPHLESRGARRLFSPISKTDQYLIEFDSDESGPSSVQLRQHPLSFSPTINLPNFVIDGTAPHLLERSPEKSKENIDWLTRIRKERYGSHNTSNGELPSNPNQAISNTRRRSTSIEPRKTPKTPTSPLLRFLKTTIKSSEKN